MPLEFLVLGSLEVREGGRTVPLGRGNERALLALLLLNANEPVSTERLVDELWGERPPPTAAKIVQNYVSRLRRALTSAAPEEEGRLLTREAGYELRVARDELDETRFEDLVTAGRAALGAGDVERAAADLSRALALWRGRPLAEFSNHEFAQAAISRLQERRLVALEERIEADLLRGRHADVVAEVEALVAEHPFRERFQAQLMLALYRSGRQSDALAAYSSARRTLAEELGLEPGPELRRLEQAILVQDEGLLLPARERAAPPPEPPAHRVADRTPRASRLRLAGLAAVLAVAITAGSVGLALARRDASPSKEASVSANSVAVIDAETGEVEAEIAVGQTPTSVAFGGGAVWALNADDQTISQIDVGTRRVRQFGVGETPTDLAFGAGELWVARGERPGTLVGHPVATSLARVDPALGDVRASVELPVGAGSVSNAVDNHVAVAGGTVWALNPDSSLSRIEARSGRATHIGGVRAVAVAADRRAAWVLTTDGSLVRVDARTLKVGRPIRVAATTLGDIELGAGSVWVSAPYDGVVWRIDPGPPLVMKTISVGPGVDKLAFGEGALWAASGLVGRISRIDPGSDSISATVAVGNTPRGLTVGDGRIWVTVGGSAGRIEAAARSGATTGVRPMPDSFCGGLLAGTGRSDVLIVSDLPLQGGSAFPTLQMSQAVAFVLRQHDFRAGRYRVAYQSCDDSTAQTGIFDAAKCASNGSAYGANPDVIGVVGPFNSGCAFALIPAANASPGGALPVVSPTTSIVGLTRPAPRAPRQALARLYPTGRRNYVRLSPTEDYEAAANAMLARRLGLRRLAVLHDGDELFGVPRAVYFRRAAARLGLRVVSNRRWDPGDPGYGLLAATVARSRPDGVFLGGGLYTNGAQLIRDLRDELPAGVPILAPQFLPVAALVEEAGEAALGTYVSLPGAILERLPPAGARFVREFGSLQPAGRVQISSVYAAQATELLLAAIARSDGSRESVRRQLLAARTTDGILGDFRITSSGDTTLQEVTLLRVVRGGGEQRLASYEGARLVARLVPPRRLVE